MVFAQATGWEEVEVPAVINFDAFFVLLVNKQFPVATFIRSREEFDYLQEPDVFHDIFGHCPLLTNPAFTHFMLRIASQVTQPINSNGAICPGFMGSPWSLV
jgi:phenylalanine-4-hydroxylase